MKRLYIALSCLSNTYSLFFTVLRNIQINISHKPIFLYFCRKHGIMKLNKQILFYSILFIVTVVTKIICAPQIGLSGFSAIFAVALFSGITAKQNKFGIMMPLLILLLSDVVLQVLHSMNLFPFAGFYKGQTTIYALTLLLTLFGLVLSKPSVTRLITGVIAGPTLFFLVSNFIVWSKNGGLGYSRDFSGLITCYAAALPFYKNSLLSTMIFLPSFAYMYNRLVLGSKALATVSTK
jgi:hypothetical protein